MIMVNDIENINKENMDHFPFNPTELGKAMGLDWGGQVINRMLAEFGYIRGRFFSSSKDMEYDIGLRWIPTEKGKKYCEVRYGIADTVYLSWSKDIIPLFLQDYENRNKEREKCEKERLQLALSIFNNELEKHGNKLRLVATDLEREPLASDQVYRYDIKKKIYKSPVHIYFNTDMKFERLTTTKNVRVKFEDLR